MQEAMLPTTCAVLNEERGAPADDHAHACSQVLLDTACPHAVGHSTGQLHYTLRAADVRAVLSSLTSPAAT
jgi:hypothetical protein